MSVSISPRHLALACLLSAPDGGLAARRRARALLSGAAPDGEDAARIRQLAVAAAPAVEADLARAGWRWIAADEADFPPGAASLADPPLGLFVRGAPPASPAVALVGARRATSYGRAVAEYLGRELAAGGAWVVSGMARGVDAAAHRGALAGGGRTVAVWGAGPDVVYPPEHAGLADEIAAAGGLLTEYPPGTPPRPGHFPERNRLIAGLARVVVVVEADERSGALITARLALEEGREVMAVPGSVFSRLSAGPNGLLRAGAAPAVTAADVLAAAGLAAGPARGGEEPTFLAHLPHGEALAVDELAARAAIPVAGVLETLLELELAGWVVRQEDGRYRRRGSRQEG